MDVKCVTVDNILEILSDEEKEEVLRPDFRVPLQHFLTGYNRRPVFPREIVIHKFKNYARRRAAVKATISENPVILQNDLGGPIIIIGLPRSGTTFLQRLLLSDPQFIGPMFWEMIEPVPSGRPENWKESVRFKKAEEDPEAAALTSGVLDRKYYARLELPAECFLLLRLYFADFIDPLINEDLAELRDFMYNAPEEHVTNAYEFFKKCLQCLFNGNLKPGMNLILKCPISCLHLETLQKTFPTARFIFPYRNAKDMVTSESSLIAGVSKALTNVEDLSGAGRRAVEYFKYGSVRVVNFLEKLPQEAYISVPYAELVQKPLDVVQQIYSHFNLDLQPETMDQMQIFIKENYQYKYGKVEDNPEDYGITDEVIKENMKEYLEYFKNGPEK